MLRWYSMNDPWILLWNLPSELYVKVPSATLPFLICTTWAHVIETDSLKGWIWNPWDNRFLSETGTVSCSFTVLHGLRGVLWGKLQVDERVLAGEMQSDFVCRSTMQIGVWHDFDLYGNVRKDMPIQKEMVCFINIYTSYHINGVFINVSHINAESMHIIKIHKICFPVVDLLSFPAHTPAWRHPAYHQQHHPRHEVGRTNEQSRWHRTWCFFWHVLCSNIIYICNCQLCMICMIYYDLTFHMLWYVHILLHYNICMM